MDLADETYEVVQASENHQIPNPDWRQFTNIFKDGKKVSLRNVQQAPVTSDSQLTLERLNIPSDAQAHEV